MSNHVDILVLADRSIDGLAPIRDDMPVAMLPVAGKAIIDHVVETIATNGPANISLCLGPNDKRTAAHVMRRNFANVAIAVDRGHLRAARRRSLVVRGDSFPSPAILAGALDEIRSTGELRRDLLMDGIWLLPESAEIPSWRAMLEHTRDEDFFLPGFDAYHRLALRAARGEFNDLHPGGWMTADGIRAGFRARVETRRALGRAVEIGAHAFVDRNVMLGDNVVLGAGAYVARNARLENVVVLPNTIIAEGFEANGAVIGQGWLQSAASDANPFGCDGRGLGALAARDALAGQPIGFSERGLTQ